MSDWIISARQGLIIIESGPDAWAGIACEIDHVGTYDGGFYVWIDGRPVQFKATAAEALRCWGLLVDLLAQP